MESRVNYSSKLLKLYCLRDFVFQMRKEPFHSILNKSVNENKIVVHFDKLYKKELSVQKTIHDEELSNTGCPNKT